MIKSPIVKTACVAVAFVLATAAGTFAQDTARMEQVIQSHVSAGTFMGTVLVARDGKVVLDVSQGGTGKRGSENAPLC